jgi:hypothetical protein
VRFGAFELFYLEDGGSRFLQNAGIHLLNQTASHPSQMIIIYINLSSLILVFPVGVSLLGWLFLYTLYTIQDRPWAAYCNLADKKSPPVIEPTGSLS